MQCNSRFFHFSVKVTNTDDIQYDKPVATQSFRRLKTLDKSENKRKESVTEMRQPAMRRRSKREIERARILKWQFVRFRCSFSTIFLRTAIYHLFRQDDFCVKQKHLIVHCYFNDSVSSAFPYHSAVAALDANSFASLIWCFHKELFYFAYGDLWLIWDACVSSFSSFRVLVVNTN